MKNLRCSKQILNGSTATILVCMLFILLTTNQVWAFKLTPNDGDVSFTATPASKGAIFKTGETVIYNIDILNPTGSVESGKITFRINTPHGKLVAEDSMRVSVGSNGSKHIELNMPGRQPGFYKVSFMINVDDYDDTIRRAFGVDPEKIVAEAPKPADFDQFWQNTKAELAAVQPDYKMTYLPDSDKDNRKLYLVEMKSLDNLTIRAWLTIPNSKYKKKKFAVLLGLPGYQVNLIPGYGDDPDVAVMYLNVRGQGNSRDVIHTRRADFITYNVEDKNKYVMRGVIMDCIRAIDFICTRPELDKDKILVTGGSMGGYLAAAVAGLDNRVGLYSAQNPILCNIRGLVGSGEWPIKDIETYAKTKPGVGLDKILDNLDYYDTKNFAPNISRPILVGIGLLDWLAPPENEYAFINQIPIKYRKIMVFENLGHEVPIAYVNYQGKWMRDEFALF